MILICGLVMLKPYPVLYCMLAQNCLGGEHNYPFDLNHFKSPENRLRMV